MTHPQLAHAIALSKAGRNAEAILIINQLVVQGDPDALAMMAEMKWRGGMVPQDPVQARALYERAAAAGHKAAVNIVTNLLASGIAGPRNWPQALQKLKNEARADPRRRDALALLRKMALTPQGDPASLPTPRVLSEAPFARLIPGLFSAGECDYLRQLASPAYQPSFVYDANRKLVSDPIRTSDGSTLHWLIEDPAVHALNRRLAAASGTAFECGEAMQILRYRPGQQYRPHLDFVRAAENQRTWTALVWLNHDFEGGETRFTKTGLAVKGRRGDALIFRNALPDGQPDPASEHEGVAVASGTKFLVSRWIRENRWVP